MDTTDGSQQQQIEVFETKKDDDSITMKVDAAGGPEFVTKLQDMEVVDGSPVILSVKVKGKNGEKK